MTYYTVIFVLVILGTSYTNNADAISLLSKLIPDCVFGVHSISFNLYTRDHYEGVKIEPNATANEIEIHKGAPIIFLIHGFTSEANNSNYYDLARVWLNTSDVNIFSVDWSDAACSNGFSITDLLSYGAAVHNVPSVGEHVAKFIVRLSQLFNISINETLIVGHSLGAHVAGFTGKDLQRMANTTIEQIIGLDPAGPTFEHRSPKNRLSSEDAQFVQIFHTSFTFGMHIAIGDVDFYFNGGLFQPGCILATCSHSRAVLYLTASIADECFTGVRWKLGASYNKQVNDCTLDTCANPGLEVINEEARGIFYVKTQGTFPYCNSNSMKTL